MFEDEETARLVLSAFREASDRFVQSLAHVRVHASEEEQRAYAEALGKVMGEMFARVMDPIVTAHPTLLPDGWRTTSE